MGGSIAMSAVVDTQEVGDQKGRIVQRQLLWEILCKRIGPLHITGTKHTLQANQSWEGSSTVDGRIDSVQIKDVE